MSNMRLLLVLVISVFFSNAFPQKTELVYLSGTDAAHTVKWDFYCTDGMNSEKWTKIDVPSNWELQGFGNYNYGHDWNNKDRKLGKEHGLYKHTFEVPSAWKGKTVNIVFDGSMTDTKVQINGKQAGEVHQGAFYRFKYDITKLLKYGKINTLEVDVAKHSANESVNRAERQADYWIFGGIFRPVFLEVLPKTHIVRSAINAKADGSFEALIQTNNSSREYTIDIELVNLQGEKIGKTITSTLEKDIDSFISGKFENIEAWNPEYPTLYDMHIKLKNADKLIHTVKERIGFRTVELRKNDGIYVNNTKVVLKGVNRHSFWPETGRCLSEENHLTDIRLMKEMNMNAVRMSHYVPDQRFLELCDSLGLFVLDEIAGWQDAYDTIVGPKVIKETVLKDENHPSVIMWDHSNEGGWNMFNAKWFHTWDIQKRPIIYPGILRNGINTKHYPGYDYVSGQFISANEVFMPTEFLHGLYDGGHGAGLEEYWSTFESSPLNAGGFLWSLVDEAVLRVDKEGTVFDSDGNHGADGILGPHREKEASFYTIRHIWSPVQVKPLKISPYWDGKLILENNYSYSNLNECIFKWKAIKTKIGQTQTEIIGFGTLDSPDVLPGENALIQISCSDEIKIADIFEFEAIDKNGNSICNWSWPVRQPAELSDRFFKASNTNFEIEVKENDSLIRASVNGLEITFHKHMGTIQRIEKSNKQISISGGPVPVGIESNATGTFWKINEQGNFVFQVSYSSYPGYINWELHKNGLLSMEAGPVTQGLKEIDFLGLSFNYPEENCKSVSWLGQGPYRVWKNRTKGNNFGVWEKEYNNTLTGESYNSLIYPEFKGYHANLYWLRMETTESPFTIISETPHMFFQLFKADKHPAAAGGVQPLFPEGELSILYTIPAIGTKFRNASSLGPKSEKQKFWKDYFGHEEKESMKIWFDFRDNND